jgi:hypothetical protein
MARVTIKFITLHLEDDQVESFLKKLEQILKDFSGSAYNFRYEVEGASSRVTSKSSEKRT